MNDLPEVLDINTIARTRLFHIESVDLMFGNGQYAQFERFMGEGAMQPTRSWSWPRLV